jgi:hypothetical protein
MQVLHHHLNFGLAGLNLDDVFIALSQQHFANHVGSKDIFDSNVDLVI